MKLSREVIDCFFDTHYVYAKIANRKEDNANVE
jgi:hypothetical protein